MKVQNNSQIRFFLHRAKSRKSCSRLDAGLVCEVLSNPKSQVFLEPFASALEMLPWYRFFRHLSRILGEMGAQRARKKERTTGSKIGASVVSALAAAESTNARSPRSPEWKFRIRRYMFLNKMLCFLISPHKTIHNHLELMPKVISRPETCKI